MFEGLAGPAEALDALVTSGDARCLAGAWVGGRPVAPRQAPGYGAVIRGLAERAGFGS